eukprot:3131152-Ditylum_brightwellii.AAC.1
MKAKESKGNRKPRGERDRDGGLGTQYNVQQQLSNFPRGTILVPMQPQAGQDAQVHNASTMPSTNPTNNSNPVLASDESNEVHAANFLQLANGNF